MKRVNVSSKIVLLLVLVISGCSPRITRIQETRDLFITDFREYSEKGFFFSPYSYHGEHESVGLITLHYEPELELVKVSTAPEGSFDAYM